MKAVGFIGAGALAARRAAGVRWGRRKGSGKVKARSYKEEIVALLRNGSAKAYVARRYGVSEPPLHNWLNENGIDTTPIPLLEKTA
jgi:DNA invertase Pin-like site-specific DNA recombinase